MTDQDPFTLIPLGKRARPLIVSRDRRAANVEEYIAQSSTNSRMLSQTTRARVVILMMTIVGILIVFRTAYLQVVRGSFYRQSSEQNRIRLESIEATRGIIYDRAMQPLLNNAPNFTLYATPADLPKSADDRRTIADQVSALAPALSQNDARDKLASIVAGSTQPIILLEHVDYQTALKITTAIARIPGISLNAVPTRNYLDSSAMAHLIGYLGKPTQTELAADASLTTLSQIGRMGLEEQYDSVLRGTDGVREVERDHLNKELAVVASKDPVAGKNLVLGIDKGLQDTLSAALHDTVTKLHVPGAAAVAIDPRNGEVRALVSEPSFDPNLFTQGGTPDQFAAIFNNTNHPLVFRAVSGTYPSGSTIKPVVASAALAEHIVTEQTTVSSTGGIKVGPNFFPDWKAGGHGTTNVTKALAESVNTFFYMVGGGYQDFKGLGIDRLVSYMKKFGLSQPTGIDVPSEAKGFIPDETWRSRPGATRWYVGDTYNLSIGQGYIAVTPLQVAAYTAAVANGGTLYQPHVVTKILNPDGTTDSVIQPKANGTALVADQYLSIVRAGMRQAVTNGSARQMQGLPVDVAAKTGTAQFGNEGKTHAWFTCFAPYQNPELVVTVIVEAAGEGSSWAQPIAKSAIQEYFSSSHTAAP